jgi:hypothetical protein
VSESNYSLEQIVSVGQEAQSLLQNPVFGMAYGAVLEDLQKRFFETEPGHTRTLEELRREGNALAKVVTLLNRYVTQAETMLAQQSQRGEG